MKTTPLFWMTSGVTLLVGLGIGFGIGRSSTPESTAPESRDGASSPPRYERTVQDLSNIPETPAPRRVAVEESAPVMPVVSYERGAGDPGSEFHRNPDRVLGKALQASDQIDRYLAFAEVLQGLDETNIQQALQAFEDLPRGYDRTRELSLLLRAWASFDGASAMAWVEDRAKDDGRMRWMGGHSVMSGWATTDPDGALAWARENFEGEENPYLLGVIDGVANNDVNRASSIMESMPYGRMRGQAVESMVGEFMRKGPSYAKRWAERLDEDKLREGVVARVAGSLARQDPEGAAEWAAGLRSETDRVRGVATAAGQWTRTDAPAAADWAMSVEDPAVRKEAVNSVVGYWSRRDVRSAAEWLSQYPASPELDAPVQTLVGRMRRSDPEAALTWAVSISDEEARHKSMQEVIKDWTRRDPEAAAKFLNQ